MAAVRPTQLPSSVGHEILIAIIGTLITITGTLIASIGTLIAIIGTKAGWGSAAYCPSL
jgi:hypothetical protein